MEAPQGLEEDQRLRGIEWELAEDMVVVLGSIRVMILRPMEAGSPVECLIRALCSSSNKGLAAEQEHSQEATRITHLSLPDTLAPQVILKSSLSLG